MELVTRPISSWSSTVNMPDDSNRSSTISTPTLGVCHRSERTSNSGRGAEVITWQRGTTRMMSRASIHSHHLSLVLSLEKNKHATTIANPRGTYLPAYLNSTNISYNRLLAQSEILPPSFEQNWARLMINRCKLFPPSTLDSYALAREISLLQDYVVIASFVGGKLKGPMDPWLQDLERKVFPHYVSLHKETTNGFPYLKFNNKEAVQ